LLIYDCGLLIEKVDFKPQIGNLVEAG
jgi:hypothetical protein